MLDTMSKTANLVHRFELYTNDKPAVGGPYALQVVNRVHNALLEINASLEELEITMARMIDLDIAEVSHRTVRSKVQEYQQEGRRLAGAVQTLIILAFGSTSSILTQSQSPIEH